MQLPAPLVPTQHYLIVQRGRTEGFIILDYMSRASEAIGALAGWVQQERSRPRSTRSTAWRPRRRHCDACSRAATRASSSCASRTKSTGPASWPSEHLACNYLQIHINDASLSGTRVPGQPCISRCRLIFESPWALSTCPRKRLRTVLRQRVGHARTACFGSPIPGSPLSCPLAPLLT